MSIDQSSPSQSNKMQSSQRQRQRCGSRSQSITESRITKLHPLELPPHNVLKRQFSEDRHQSRTVPLMCKPEVSDVSWFLGKHSVSVFLRRTQLAEALNAAETWRQHCGISCDTWREMFDSL
jgi:hypothetical protein